MNLGLRWGASAGMGVNRVRSGYSGKSSPQLAGFKPLSGTGFSRSAHHLHMAHPGHHPTGAILNAEGVWVECLGQKRTVLGPVPRCVRVIRGPDQVAPPGEDIDTVFGDVRKDHRWLPCVVEPIVHEGIGDPHHRRQGQANLVGDGGPPAVRLLGPNAVAELPGCVILVLQLVVVGEVERPEILDFVKRSAD